MENEKMHKTMDVKSYEIGTSSFIGQEPDLHLGSSTYVVLYNKEDDDLRKITIRFSDAIIAAPRLVKFEMIVYMRYNELPAVLSSLNGPGVLGVDFRTYNNGHINFKLYRKSN